MLVKGICLGIYARQSGPLERTAVRLELTREDFERSSFLETSTATQLDPPSTIYGCKANVQYFLKPEILK